MFEHRCYIQSSLNRWSCSIFPISRQAKHFLISLTPNSQKSTTHQPFNLPDQRHPRSVQKLNGGQARQSCLTSTLNTQDQHIKCIPGSYSHNNHVPRDWRGRHSLHCTDVRVNKFNIQIWNGVLFNSFNKKIATAWNAPIPVNRLEKKRISEEQRRKWGPLRRRLFCPVVNCP